MATTTVLVAPDDASHTWSLGIPTLAGNIAVVAPATMTYFVGSAAALISTRVPFSDANGCLTDNAAFFFTAATLALTANSMAQTVQSVAVSTTPTVNLASGNTVVLGTSGVPGALTAATNITFQNPTIGSTTQLMFKQYSTSVAVTFTIAGYTFYQNGKTAGVASGSPVLLAADMTLSCYYTAYITWTSPTTAIVTLDKS
jgi:hypothetical protein